MFSKLVTGLVVASQISAIMGNWFTAPPTKAPTDDSYDDDRNSHGRGSCHRDCIDVNGFDIDKDSELGKVLLDHFGGNMGGNNAFSGKYCLRDYECGCYELEDDPHRMYDAEIIIDNNKILFSYMNQMGNHYEIEYNKKHYYGELSCIETFFKNEQNNHISSSSSNSGSHSKSSSSHGKSSSGGKSSSSSGKGSSSRKSSSSKGSSSGKSSSGKDSSSHHGGSGSKRGSGSSSSSSSSGGWSHGSSSSRSMLSSSSKWYSGSSSNRGSGSSSSGHDGDWTFFSDNGYLSAFDESNINLNVDFDSSNCYCTY